MKALDKKKKLIIGICVLSVILLGIFTTYAYFTFKANNLNRINANLDNGTMRLRFADNDNGLNRSLAFGETVTKKFKIENTGTLEGSLSLEWLNLVNTYLHSSLTYTLEEAVKENGEYREIVPKTNVPTSTEAITGSIASEISVPAGETYYYNLNITLNNMDFNQTRDLSANLSTKFTVNNPSKHRYYLLRVNPNGGTWKEFTSSQDYLLKNNETMEIENPTRYGYTFREWDIQGTSYELEDKTFIMGISDTYLKAEWTPKKVNVIVDGETQEVDFGSTIDLGTPDKEGHTFGGWEVTGGTLNGTLLTIDTEEDITATPVLATNKYKYIVYHYKMNTDGIGYTLVNADTDEGEALFNTTVTPEVKTYTGFISPERKTLTIQAESVYPPVKNKIDYNYTRNKHTLSYNIDGITTTEEVYYEQAKELAIPEKEGYDFTNWSGAEEYIHDNVLTVPDTNVSITANFTPKAYSVTFNANGGFVSPESKVVTYDQEYGELPTPVYAGFKFLGWYTAQSDGTKINDTDTVKLSTNVTLYAQWEESNILMARANNKKLWEKSADITKVVFSKEITPKSNAAYSEDVSNNQNGSVMSYLVPNADNTTYTAYIEANGEVIGNPNSRNLFNGFTNLLTIEGLENFDTNIVKNMGSMFQKCSSLTTLDISNFNTQNVEYFYDMFAYCRNLSSLVLGENFTAINGKSLSEMFLECNNLINLNLNHFKIDSVTNMNATFSGCHSLTSLDLSGLNTSKVTDMAWLFHDCYALQTINLNSFDTSNVTDMNGMFWHCHALTTLDLSRFNTNKVTDMAYMFSECKSLTSLSLSNNFDGINVTTTSYMFHQCNVLPSLDLSNFRTDNVVNMSYMFAFCDELSTLDISQFNTSKVTNMAWMFTQCTKLLSLDLRHFDTSKVTNMELMFDNCFAIESINVSSFNTSNVTSMTAMFCRCYKLKTLNLSNFNTSNVTSMHEMFGQCYDLTSLNISSFDTSNVADMGLMFFCCSSMKTFDLNHFKTGNVTIMESMFNSCNSLTSIDVSSFDTSKVTNMKSMFAMDYSKASLQNIKFSDKFVTSNVVNFASMFQGNTKLPSLDLSNFDTSKATDMSGMFADCWVLTELKANNFTVPDSANKNIMFTYVNSAIKITVSNATTRDAMINASNDPKFTTSNFIIA